MLNDLGRSDRMTLGSHTVVVIPTRVDEIAQTPLISGALLYVAEAEQPASPVQSAGDSPLSRGLRNKFYSALAGFAELASEWLRQMWVTSSSEARASNMDPWTAKNERRIRLIKKKHREGLDPKESAELARLKSEVSAHVKQVAPRSTEALEEFEEYVTQLRARAQKKKRQ